jgi:tetratricopeptide (TPR) repeat protein
MIARWRSALLIALLLVVMGTAVALAFPYVASAYHVEAGGRATEDPLALADDPSCAVEHLQRALAWVPDNAQAYRLLARVYREQGEWAAAVTAMTQYTKMRPDNPLGHIELAEVYEEIEDAMADLPRIDLLPLLPQAEVQAPETPVDTPYGQPDGPAWQSYVAETAFSLPPGYGDRPTLFMHAPSRVTYRLSLPEQPMVLRFDMGMDPQTQNWPGDGVTFEVLVDGERIFLEHLDKARALEGWHARTVDLAPWAGTGIALSLAVTPGPVADPTGDWAGWGEPEIVDARLDRLEALSPDSRATEEWLKAGYTAERFVEVGKAEASAGRQQEATIWFERAMRLEPWWEEPYRQLAGTEGGDGLALEYLQMGDLASLEKVTRLRPGDLYVNYQFWKQAREADDLASAAVYSETLAYFPMEAIHPADERLLEYAAEVVPSLLDAGLWDRDKTLNVVSFLVWQHNGAAGVERLLQRLDRRYPGEPEWPFYLGELYHRRADLDRAEANYQQALKVDPAYAQAYLRLGMVYEARADDLAEAQWLVAADWYEKYHQLAPDDLMVLQRLTGICADLEDTGRSDRSCQEAARSFSLTVSRAGENSDSLVGVSPAAMLQEALASHTEDQRIVAQLLGVSPGAIEFGPNLIENGGFEEWLGARPFGWAWSDMSNWEPFAAAAFTGGADELLSSERQRAARVDGFWILQQQGKQQPRAGFWQADESGRSSPPLQLATDAPYVLSFDYRTLGVPDGRATAWISADAGGLLAEEPGLPATNGGWRHFVVVDWNRTGTETAVHPLLRSYAPGQVVFDNVQIRSVRSLQGAFLDPGKARSWVAGHGE